MTTRGTAALAASAALLIPAGGMAHKRYKVSFTIKRKQIGNPDKFRWRAAFLEEDKPADAAPNKGYVQHNL